MKSTYTDTKYKRALERVKEIKGFYVHLAVYLMVNTFIFLNIYIRHSYEGEAFWQESNFFVFLFWGVGVLFHALRTFGRFPYLSSSWEENQIRKFMEKDRKDEKKYRN